MGAVSCHPAAERPRGFFFPRPLKTIRDSLDYCTGEERTSLRPKFCGVEVALKTRRESVGTEIEPCPDQLASESAPAATTKRRRAERESEISEAYRQLVGELIEPDHHLIACVALIRHGLRVVYCGVGEFRHLSARYSHYGRQDVGW